MPINFPKRGAHDNKPTPEALYRIIIEQLHFTDVCVDKSKFDATAKLWPDRSFCNPPFSNKLPFVLRAAASNRAGHEILMYMPFDPTTRWFEVLYRQNALIMVFMKRLQYERWPHALYHLKNYGEPKVVLLQSEGDVLKYIGDEKNNALRCCMQQRRPG